MELLPLVEHVKNAGSFALDAQSSVIRSFKSDGSVVTAIDIAINRALTSMIQELYPGVNIIAEEASTSSYNPDYEYTFALDPLDGTDTYSMGMPGWCIALGLLKNLDPVGGIVYAPSWGPAGSLLVAEENGSITLNGRALKFTKETAYPMQVMAPSTAHRYFDYSSFYGKVRNSGSSIISMSAIILHSQVSGALINNSFIWDIAASHAIIRKLGFELEYLNGKKIEYKELVDRSPLRDYAVCGTSEAVAAIRKSFARK
ncbi:MAG: inositol monophosphatase family protein [Spirochaetia bacterium]|nr:inositol monophosphatase family protein [Spirochaetia bacterium]